MTAAKGNGSPGSHPHADRPNWQPAETAAEYFRNCQEGLETFSQRRLAKILGVSRIVLWRARMLAEIPEDLFERILAQPDHKTSTRELASIGAALAGKASAVEVERCWHCGEVQRVRGQWRAATAKPH